jgi:MtfA peptidase
MPIDSIFIEDLNLKVYYDSTNKIINNDEVCLTLKGKNIESYSIQINESGDLQVLNLNTCKYQYADESYFTKSKNEADELGDKIIMLITLGIAIMIFAAYRYATKMEKVAKESGNWLPDAVFDDYGNKLSHTDTYLTYRSNDILAKYNETTIIEDTLKKYCDFYNRLSSSDKIKFYDRVYIFMCLRNYKVHYAYATPEMPVLIAAQAITISFGLKHYKLRHFYEINVFTNEFTVGRDTSKSLQGLVQDNSITLSWNNVLTGIADSTNGINLGLHELAHAYYADNILLNPNRKNSFTEHYPAFELLAKQFASKRKIDIYGMYSEIALANTDEFFAESVELFFEKPNELKKNHKEVFEALQLLLNQPNYPLNQIPT